MASDIQENDPDRRAPDHRVIADVRAVCRCRLSAAVVPAVAQPSFGCAMRKTPALTSRGNAAVLAAIIPMKRRRIIQMRSNVRQPPGALGAHGSRRPMIGIDRIQLD